MLKIFAGIALWLFLTYGSCKCQDVAGNSSEILTRNKRFLIFNYGGQVRYVLGYLGPIDIPKWQNINGARNVQFQYNLPSKFSSLFNRFKGRKFETDSTRDKAYKILERMLDKGGVNGRECILRAICEVAETPLSHNGLIGELLHLFFTPGQHEQIDEEYRDANTAGKHGIDCVKIYTNCPLGHGVLDSVSCVHRMI